MGVKKKGREQQLPFLSDQLTWKATLCLRLEAITLGVRFKTFVCQHDRREQGCNLMRGQWEWETLHGQLHAERQREAFVRNVDMAAVGRKASAYRRNISTGIESLAEVSSSPSSDLLCGYCKGSLQPWRKHFHLCLLFQTAVQKLLSIVSAFILIEMVRLCRFIQMSQIL